MSDTRRRFLGFLGLLGAPAAVWAATAHAQDTYVPITCKAEAGTASAKVTYARAYNIIDGRLQPTAEGGHSLNQAALKASYGDGVRFVVRADDPAGFNVRSPNFLLENPNLPDNMVGSFSAVLELVPVPLDINARLTLADGTTEDAYVKFVNDSTDPTQTQLDTYWGTTSHQLLEKPLSVELIGDGKSLGTFTFNLSKINWRPYIDAEDKRIAAATGVTYDASSLHTTVDGCTGPGTMACFFTTAAVTTLGLADDCWELRTLRAFRDGPLSRTPFGRALTARYYDEAPRMVAAVGRRRDAARQWLHAYWRYVLPCAILARLGLRRLAVYHYTRLFARLADLAAPAGV